MWRIGERSYLVVNDILSSDAEASYSAEGITHGSGNAVDVFNGDTKVFSDALACGAKSAKRHALFNHEACLVLVLQLNLLEKKCQ